MKRTAELRSAVFVLLAGLIGGWPGQAQTDNPRPTLAPFSNNFGAAGLGQTAGPAIFTLQNTSVTELAINTIIISGPNASDFTQTNTCGTELAAGSTCAISVLFSPTGLGGRTATLGVVYGPTNSSLSANVLGIGTSASLPPAVTLLPGGIGFGSVPVQVRQAPQIFTLTNLTGTSVHISNIVITGTNANDFLQSTNCPATLAALASCSVAVGVTPSLVGAFVGTLEVSDDSPTSPHRATLSGNGIFSGNYEIVNARTGKVLEVADGNAGTLVRQGTFNGLQRQHWKLLPIGVGSYRIVNVMSSKVLDVVAASSTNGALVQQYDSLSGLNQQWTLTPVDDVHYKVVNQLSGKVLDIPTGNATDGTMLQQWDFNGSGQQLWVLLPTISYTIGGLGSRNLEVGGASGFNGTAISVRSAAGSKQQQWQFLPVGNGYFAILNRATGKVLDNTGSSTSNGTLVQQYDYLGGLNQQWRLAFLGGSTFKIVNRQSQKVLDLPAQVSADGVSVQQWDDLNGANQSWSITPLLYFNLVNQRSGKALEPKDASGANGALIQQAALDGSQKQQWCTISSFAPGAQYLTFVNNLTGKVLDVTAASTALGALVQQWDYLGGGNQQWRLVSLADGSYELLNRTSGKALDVISGSTADGALVQQWDYLGGSNQKWQLIGTSQ